MASVSLRTASRHYLRAYASGVVAADAVAVGELDERWTLEQHDGFVALRSVHGKYLRAYADGRAAVDADLVGELDERWTLEQVGGGVALKSIHGTFLCAEGGGGGLVVANRPVAGAWETFVMESLDGVAPGPVPVPGGPLSRLYVEGNHRYFANEAGRFDWREITAFSLLSRIVRWLRGTPEWDAEVAYVRGWLTRRRAEGFTVTRVILTLDGGYWDYACPAGRSFRCAPDMPGYWPALDTLVQLHAEAGLYLRACVLGALEPFGGIWYPDRRDVYTGPVRTKAEQFVLEVAQRVAPSSNVVLEIANEPTQIGMRDSWPAIVTLGHRVKAVAQMLLCGGEDNDGRGVVVPFDFADAHIDRSSGVEGWQWVKRMGEHPVVDQAVMPFVAGENRNMGEDRIDGSTDGPEKQPSVCFGVAAVSRARKMAGVCFHWDGGLWTTEPRAETPACIAAWHAGFNAFPMLTDGMWRGHWAESYWKRAEWPESDDPREVEAHIRRGEGPWRAFGCGPYSTVFPTPKGWDYNGGLSAPAARRGINQDGIFDVAVYERT